MSRTGQVFTKDLSIPARQHELLGMDFGEGPERKTLIFALVTFAAWSAVCAPILGAPTETTFSIYFLPPALLSFLGMRPSRRCPRRRIITEVALALRYPFRGSEPIIKLGQRRARRAERLPLGTRLERLSAGTRQLAGSTPPPWTAPKASTSATQWTDAPTSTPITLNQRAVLVSQDALDERLSR